MATHVFTKNDTIVDYDEKELYELLVDNNVSISAINQIMKLYSLDYSLSVLDAINLSTDKLRAKVSAATKKATSKSHFSSIPHALKRCAFGAGWDISGKTSFDIDIAALLLNKKGKIDDLGTGVVYFNQLRQDGIYLDDGTCGLPMDDERIYVTLDELASDIKRIVFIASIFEASHRGQNFGMTVNGYGRILDIDSDCELCRIDLSSCTPSSTAMTIAELYEKNGVWNVKTVCKGYNGDFNTIIADYV